MLLNINIIIGSTSYMKYFNTIVNAFYGMYPIMLYTLCHYDSGLSLDYKFNIKKANTNLDQNYIKVCVHKNYSFMLTSI